MSKASRGYTLLTQEEPYARKNIKLNLEKDATIEQVLTDLVQHCLDHMLANEPVILKTDDAEGVHQMRVALRRLRAALRLFKSSLPKEQYRWVVAEARWLTKELSSPRAWDVFAAEFLVPVVQFYEEEPGFDALSIAVEQTRTQARQHARDTITTERYTEFLLRVSAWLTSRAWRDQPITERTARLLDPVGDHCMQLLQKRDRIVRRQGQDIAALSDATLHELRLSVKRLRYAVDFFEGLYSTKKMKAYRKSLTTLQDRLGYLRDTMAADTLLRELVKSDGDQVPPAWAYVGGLIVGWHRHAAIAATRKLTNDMAMFLATEPFWYDARGPKNGA